MYRYTSPLSQPVLLVLASLIFSGTSIADQANTPEPSNRQEAPARIETLLVTGQYQARHQQDIPQRLLSIKAEAVQQAGTLTRLLDQAESISISNEGGSGGVSSLSLRGGEPNFTSVYIDGVQVNDPTNTRGGSYDFNGFNDANIDRIEILYGPQSAIYGSDTLSGLVQIFSRSPQQHGVDIRYSPSEYGGYKAAASAQLANDNSGLKISEQRLRAAKTQRGSELDGEQKSFQAHWHRELFAIDVHAQQRQQSRRAYPEQSGGPRLAQSSELDQQDKDEQQARVSLSFTPNEVYLSRLVYQDFELHSDFHSPGIEPYEQVPANSNIADYDYQAWQWLHTLNITEAWQLSFGADGKNETGISEGQVSFTSIPADGLLFLAGLDSLPFPLPIPLNIPLPLELDTGFSLSREHRGYFAEILYSDAFGLEGATLQISGRRDNSDSSANKSYEEDSYRLGLRLPLTDKLALRMNWGQGFKLPSFFALGHGLVGNPDLEPERATSTELGLDLELDLGLTQLQSSLNLFDNQYRDLIDFDAENFTNINRSEVNTRGAALAINWQLRACLTLRSALSYTDIEVPNSEREFSGRPRWQSDSSLRWQWQENWEASWHYQWRDSTYATSLYSGELSEHRLAPVQLQQLHLQWQAMPLLGLSLHIHNLWDKDYEEAPGFVAAGRYAQLGLSFSWR